MQVTKTHMHFIAPTFMFICEIILLYICVYMYIGLFWLAFGSHHTSTKLLMSSAHYSQIDGQMERTYKTLEETLCCPLSAGNLDES